MSVYVSDDEMDLFRELYDFYSTQMEGSNLDESGKEEYEHKLSIFWSFYDKRRKSKADRKVRNRVKSILRAKRKEANP